MLNCSKASNTNAVDCYWNSLRFGWKQQRPYLSVQKNGPFTCVIIFNCLNYPDQNNLSVGNTSKALPQKLYWPNSVHRLASYNAYSHKEDHVRYRSYRRYYHGPRPCPPKVTCCSKAWDRLQSFVGMVVACNNFGRYPSGNVKPRNSGGKICLIRFPGRNNA